MDERKRRKEEKRGRRRRGGQGKGVDEEKKWNSGTDVPRTVMYCVTLALPYSRYLCPSLSRVAILQGSLSRRSLGEIFGQRPHRSR